MCFFNVRNIWLQTENKFFYVFIEAFAIGNCRNEQGLILHEEQVAQTKGIYWQDNVNLIEHLQN